MALPIPLAASVSFAPLVKCFWTLVSLLILRSEVVIPEVIEKPLCDNRQFQDAFKMLCIDEEILDTKYYSYDYFAYSYSDFSKFVSSRRNYYRQIRHYPHLTDISRFPYSNEYASRMHELAGSHKKYAESMAERTPFGQDDRDAWLYFADLSGKSLYAWACYCNACHKDAAVGNRRDYLNDLRQCIGTRNFEQGVMPDACPFKMPPN